MRQRRFIAFSYLQSFFFRFLSSQWYIQAQLISGAIERHWLIVAQQKQQHHATPFFPPPFLPHLPDLILHATRPWYEGK